MELRQLRCLIAVADTLHFGKAAQQMDMLPASFGRQIKLLEDRLGSRLLVRTTRHVSLTEAGRDFVEAARDIVDRADRLEAEFREGQQDQLPVLRIGAIDSAAAGLMPQFLPHFRELYPKIDIELMEQKTIRLLPRVLSGRLDAAIVRPPEVRDTRLKFRSLFNETAVVAVPEQHDLATKTEITVADMADEPLIVPERQSRPHSHDLTMKLFLGSGYAARVAQVAEEKQTIVSLVSTGVGLAIVPKWASRLAVGGVRFVPLSIPPGIAREKLALSVVWLRDTRHPARDAFLDVLDANVEALSRTA
ncbi:LysR family transcriptional regulator [Epibacterium sp. SM1979]|uniref:LysR family transcriptional regulator n=1 Tax=Tritonibacter litoralis TaxID=2662264 RepID=A0A843YHU3_9RHOB|nr:LysR family transcriptional regulator [Tritonibacter litoralis]MQQ09245.1 LysR family transcriptional regulator [Tritonibacter litoralis]